MHPHLGGDDGRQSASSHSKASICSKVIMRPSIWKGRCSTGRGQSRGSRPAGQLYDQAARALYQYARRSRGVGKKCGVTVGPVTARSLSCSVEPRRRGQQSSWSRHALSFRALPSSIPGRHSEPGARRPRHPGGRARRARSRLGPTAAPPQAILAYSMAFSCREL